VRVEFGGSGCPHPARNAGPDRIDVLRIPGAIRKGLLVLLVLHQSILIGGQGFDEFKGSRDDDTHIGFQIRRNARVHLIVVLFNPLEGDRQNDFTDPVVIGIQGFDAGNPGGMDFPIPRFGSLLEFSVGLDCAWVKLPSLSPIDRSSGLAGAAGDADGCCGENREEILAAALCQLEEGIAVLDAASRVLFWNPRRRRSPAI
jgi:PAS domain-containing protein